VESSVKCRTASTSLISGKSSALLRRNLPGILLEISTSGISHAGSVKGLLSLTCFSKINIKR